MKPLADDDPAEIGGYLLEARLGTGGMGRVYLASTPAGRAVALKVVRPELIDNQEFRTRFQQEVQAAQRVHGLYTAQLVDADPAAMPPWLVTTYVPGPSLEEAVAANGPMPTEMVLRLMAGVAEALRAIHAADLVHRDLKPSNVLLAQDGPRVIDFGIARALEVASMTRTDTIMGSPGFLAPEQVLGLHISPAVDVFALGSLGFYAAVGRPPFGLGHDAAITYRVVHNHPDLDDCPAQLVAVIGACLEKDARARPTPGQIIEFCVSRAAELPSSSQAWLDWSLAGTAPVPEHVPGDNARGGTGTGDYRSGRGRNLGGDQADIARMRRLNLIRFVTSLAVTALVATLIAIAVTLHLTMSHNGNVDNSIASSVASSHRSVAPTARGTAGVPPPAPAPAQAVPSRKTTTPLVLLSQDHPATASSVEGNGLGPSNAVDGNLQTRWSSAFSDPQWLGVDLGATHAIGKIALDWEHAYATAFQIQTSVDGTTWTDIYATTMGDGGDQTIYVSGAGRYVRMHGTRRATSYGYSLREFQVFGTP